jgi:hypothetical protein
MSLLHCFGLNCSLITPDIFRSKTARCRQQSLLDRFVQDLRIVTDLSQENGRKFALLVEEHICGGY